MMSFTDDEIKEFYENETEGTGSQKSTLKQPPADDPEVSATGDRPFVKAGHGRRILPVREED